MPNDTAAIEQALAQGLAAHRAGRLDDAERAYRAAMALAPGQAEPLYLLGMMQLQRGRPGQAEPLLRQAVALLPNEPNPHYYQGEALAALKRFAEALDSFDRAIALNPGFAQALVDRGLALAALGRAQDAIESFRQAAARDPALAAAHFHHGAALMGQGQPDAAIGCFDQVIALEPDHAETWFQRAQARFACRDFAGAVADYGRAIALKPNLPTAFVNRGNAHYAARDLAAALADYDRAIALNPGLAEAYLNRGNALAADRRLTEALADYDRAIALQPAFAQAYLNRATTRGALKRPAEALADCDRAIALMPDNAQALADRADLLAEQGRHGEAARDYRRACALDPGQEYAQGGLVRAMMQLCDWRDFDAGCAALTAAIDADIPQAPFSLLFAPSSAALQRRCAARYIAASHPPLPPLRQGAIHRPGRIRLGYLSGTFRAHPTTALLGGLFARHDKTRFETFAFSFGPDDGSAARRDLPSAFDHFLDVSDGSDRQTAQRIAALDIDILVDLDGFIEGARTGILAHRPAPVQVNYLGYPGTIGAPYIDYILADAVLIPPGDEKYYAEKIARLPGTYQPNSNRPAPAPRPGRAALGLPEGAFVFCSFNNHYKITPDIFAAWMRLLEQAPGSVLWLLTTQDAARENLVREAARHGIGPQRLVFAGVAEPPQHLARLGQADLFLDTLYCSAHTTASDALWMGLPLVTCGGPTFAGRVAASVLHAAGLPELVTRNLVEYEALALRLARDPGLLQSFRDRLAGRGNVLFDKDRYLRHLEAAYQAMADMARRGEAPRSFDVPAP